VIPIFKIIIRKVILFEDSFYNKSMRTNSLKVYLLVTSELVYKIWGQADRQAGRQAGRQDRQRGQTGKNPDKEEGGDRETGEEGRRPSLYHTYVDMYRMCRCACRCASE
jgi:hypothetical protein